MSSPGKGPKQTPNLDALGRGAVEELALVHGGWEKGLSRGHPLAPGLSAQRLLGSLSLPFPE